MSRTDDLIERLMREHPPGHYPASFPGALVNPDGPEAAAKIERLTARVEELEAALTKAAHTFSHYEDLHRLKCTTEGDEKAERNREMADLCNTALGAKP